MFWMYTSPAERLSLTLCFLATGESQQSLSFAYRIGKQSVSDILKETCAEMFEALCTTYLREPSTKDDWLSISKDFENTWNLPHVIGAIDGKHIRIVAPRHTETLYHSYKGFFSLQFLALCDARYCFTCIDIGNYGNNNYTTFLNASKIGKTFASNTMCPIPRPLMDVRLIPYLITSKVMRFSP